MPTLVLRNDKAIDSMRTEYVSLYAPTTSWEGIIDMNQGLPGLRGYWPMNNPDENDDVYDLSGQGRKMVHYP